MHGELDTVKARREFLKKCGKFAVVTPPAVALMLSAQGSRYAAAASGLSGGATGIGGSSQGNNGFGNGGNDGVGGRSGSSQSPNAGEFSADEIR